MRLLIGAACSILLVAVVGAGCGVTSFALANAAVDATYSCPVGANNSPYDLHATVDANNSTRQAVDVRSASAVMVVVAVHGQWQQKVGSTYETASVAVTPQTVGANSKTTLRLTIPSACSNGAHQGVADNHGDYSVQLTVITSAGTFKLTSQNRHRIVAP